MDGWFGTVISAGPVTVTEVRTTDKDGYTAIQLGFGERKLSRLNKSVQGHIKSTLPKEELVSR